MGFSQMALAQFHLPKMWDGGRQVADSNPAGYTLGLPSEKKKKKWCDKF
jgi:hypothetical protein